jgi:type IV pilus assembly protein PilB
LITGQCPHQIWHNTDVGFAFAAPPLDLDDAVDVQRLPKGLLDQKICQTYRLQPKGKMINQAATAIHPTAAAENNFSTQMGVDWVIASTIIIQLRTRPRKCR